MKTLFSAFDDEGNDAISIPLKIGILINGNDSIDKSEMIKEFGAYLKETLVDRAGFEEIDDDPAPLVGDDDEVFRFKGPLAVLAFFLDKMCRRELCLKQDSPYLKQIYSFINESSIFKKLAAEKDISEDSYLQLTNFLASIPVNTKAINLTDELAEVIRDGLQCV